MSGYLSTAFLFVGVVFFLVVLFSTFAVVNQGYMLVTTVFGKHRRTLPPGLHVLIPFFERRFMNVSVQNRTTELEFQAITQDLAQVGFKATLLWAVADSDPDTIKDVAFKFRSEDELLTALERSVEGETRGIVAATKQADVPNIRGEIVLDLQRVLDVNLKSWGYKLIDVQINDIRFDDVITESMARVVASANSLAAATNEGNALLIKATKEAEAHGAAIVISATAQKDAADLEGQGVALFREKSTQGLTDALGKLDQGGIKDAMAMVMFSMWTETVKVAAVSGSGNVIFLDGSPEGMGRSIREMMANSMLTAGNTSTDESSKSV